MFDLCMLLFVYLFVPYSFMHLFICAFIYCMYVCVCVLFSCKPNYLQVDLFHDWLIESWINRSMYGVFACI